MIEVWKDKPAAFEGDLAVGPLYADRPPTRGLAGWADWLLGGPLSGLIHDGHAKIAPGEKVLIAGRAPFQTGKIVLVGCSAPATSARSATELAESFAEAIGGLAPKKLLVEVAATDGELFLQQFAKALGDDKIKIYAYVPETPCRI